MKKFTLALCLALSSVALAATDGTLGATSSGDINITLDIQDMILVSGLSDVVLPTFAGGVADSTNSVDFCVYRNNGAATAYDVNLDDGTANGTFELNGPSTTLPYSVNLNGIAITEGATTANAAFAANNTSTTCGGTPNTTIDITVLNADLQTAESGTYTGTLNITVSPI